jgi:hypothetical protein
MIFFIVFWQLLLVLLWDEASTSSDQLVSTASWQCDGEGCAPFRAPWTGSAGRHLKAAGIKTRNTLIALPSIQTSGISLQLLGSYSFNMRTQSEQSMLFSNLASNMTESSFDFGRTSIYFPPYSWPENATNVVTIRAYSVLNDTVTTAKASAAKRMPSIPNVNFPC